MSRLTTFLYSIFLLALIPACAVANARLGQSEADASLEKLLRQQPFFVSDARRLNASYNSDRIKGWDYGFKLLTDKGIDPQYLVKVFSDSRMPERENVLFSLSPKESGSIYRKQNTTRNRHNALDFYLRNQAHFRKAELYYHVPQNVILSILQVESNCGKYTGNERVLPKLMRLAFVGAPDNIDHNLRIKHRTDADVRREQVASRALWLQETFLPHVIGALILAHQKGVHPLDLRGSVAGALAMPQFLPGNYLVYGVDGDNNGTVDLTTAPDAIWSVANFLRQHGWKERSIPISAKREVIRNYNRSNPYVETVLAMSSSLGSDIERLETRRASMRER